MNEAAVETRRTGILGIARFYHDPRGSALSVIAARPREAKLFAYLLFSGLILLIGRLIQLFASPGSSEDIARWAAEQTVSLLFFLPLLYYLLATLVTALARLFGGNGHWYEGRVALFWAALVSAPIMVLSMLAGTALHGINGWLSFGAGQVGAVFFAWALACTISACFDFQRVWLVLAIIVVLALSPVALIALAWG